MVHLFVQQYPLDSVGITPLQDGNSVVHPHKPREVKGHRCATTIHGVHQLEEGEGCCGAGMDFLDRALESTKGRRTRIHLPGAGGRAYEKPSIWVARCLHRPGPVTPP